MSAPASRFTFARHPFTSNVLARPSLRALVVDQAELNRLHSAFLRADELLNTPAPVTEVPNIAVAYRKALEAGQALPKGLAEAQVKADSAAAVRAAERAALSTVHNQVGLELALLVEDSVEAMYEGLDAELQALLDHATAQLDALGGSIDPLRAMKAKKATEFQAFAEDHEVYLRIRSDAELVLIQEAGRPAIDTDYALFRVMRHAGRVWPDWKVSREGPQREGVMKRYDDAPWPADIRSLDFFAWLVANRDTAAPWVPSYSQMQAARAAGAGPLVPAPREHSALAREYGGEEAAVTRSLTARKVRENAGRDRAAEADFDATYIRP